MAFRSDLYRAENIIGYTGRIHEFPTVYFRCDRLGLAGHITQAHEWPQNIGRLDPFPTDGYRWENKMTSDGEVMVEYIYNWKMHTSRNKFIELGGSVRGGGANRFDIQAYAILVQAIRACPDEKQMHAMDDRMLKKLKAVRNAKDTVMSQLNQLSAMAKRGEMARALRGL